MKTSHYKGYCISLFKVWHQAAQKKQKTRGSLLERQHYFLKMRFIGKLRTQAQISKVKAGIKARLQQFRGNNLKIKALNGFKQYLKSENCIQYKTARLMHRSNLIKHSIAGLKVRAALAKLRKQFTTKHKILNQKSYFDEWIKKT